MPRYPYEEIAEWVRARVADGTYPPGARLPSRSQLRDQFGVSDPVVGSAMRILKHEGLVVTLNGVGAFVAEKDGPG